jgi:hypothetical protein
LAAAMKSPFEKGKLWKKSLLVVTPVKTGVQDICKDLKRWDSGFRRNDRVKKPINFFTASGNIGGFDLARPGKNHPNPPL